VRRRKRSLRIAFASGAVLLAIALLHGAVAPSGRYTAGYQAPGAEQHNSAPLAPLAPQLAPPGYAPKQVCAAVSISGTAAAQLPSGSTVTMVASATGCSAPTYRFWVLAPGSRWSMVQEYGAGNTFTSKPLGATGTYKFEVDVRDASSAQSYDATTTGTYTVAGCAGATLTPSTPSPHRRGASIELTATATCPAAPAFRFLVRAPGGSWRVVQDYSANRVFAWTPDRAGTYSLEVDVRDQGATAAYEAVSNLTYTVS